MKKKFLLVSVLCAAVCLMLTVSVRAAGTSMPQEQSNKITLTEDVTLSSEHKVESGKHTIDLNGHTITASNSYTINVEKGATLTITDSSTGKTGKVIHTSSENSCIRNAGNLTLDGVKVESNFVCVKNESTGTATINNSTLITSYDKVDSGAIFNHGKLTATGSTIKSTGRGVSIFGNAGTVTAKNCTIEGKSPMNAAEGAAILVTGGKVTGGSIGMFPKGTIVVSGKVEAPVSINLERFMTAGSTLVLAESEVLKSSVNIPEDVTLEVPANKKLTLDKKGNLNIAGSLKGTVDGTIYNKTKNSYYGTLEQALVNANLNEDEDTLVVLKDTEETEFLFSAAQKAKSLTNNKNTILDLNGHKVKTTLKNAEGAELEVVDTSKSKKGTFDGTVTNDGVLTVEAGNFTEMPVTTEKATTTLNGGTYPIKDLQNAVIPEGKELVKNADGTYSIRSIVPEADEEEKDDTPDTGIDVFAVVGAILVVSALGAVVLNKRK